MTPSATSAKWLSAILSAGAAAGLASTPARAAEVKEDAPVKFKTVYAKEAASQKLCEATDNRIFVKTKLGSECLAYFVTSGSEDQKSAVIFLDGDAPPEIYEQVAHETEPRQPLKNGLTHWSRQLKVRYIAISRVGLSGSSGNHGDRRKKKESLVMNAAADILKAKLGLETIALAGQSGGSTIAANMLAFGRTDVTCAVLGSGRYEVAAHLKETLAKKGHKVSEAKIRQIFTDPISEIDSIKADEKRRVLVLGDPDDMRTAFDQQLRYAEALRDAGHRAGVIKTTALGSMEHDSSRYTVPAAGLCLKGMEDGKIARAVLNLVPKAKPVAMAGDALLIKTSLQSGK